MAGGEGGAPPPEKAPSKDRCPSCGGLLTFEPGWPGGFCAIEAIFVDAVPTAQPEAERPPLVRDAILRASKKQLHDLCRAYGLHVSGNKTDLLTRILRYMDELRIDLPPEEREGAFPADAPLVPTAEGVADEPPPVEEPGPTEPAVETPAKPPDAVVSGTVEGLLQEIEHAAVRAEAVPIGTEAALPQEWSQESVSETSRVDPTRLRRDRRTFYTGTILSSAGGIGLLFGSFLHDLLRVPVVGDSYETFGPLNMIAAIGGALVLLAGVGAIAWSLRGGVVRGESLGV